MRTFLAITDPKTEQWLVKTVGLILAVIDPVLIYGQRTGTINPPVIFLAIGGAASLVAIDVIYVIKKVISPIYLGDAFVEIVLMIWWAVALFAA